MLSRLPATKAATSHGLHTSRHLASLKCAEIYCHERRFVFHYIATGDRLAPVTKSRRATTLPPRHYTHAIATVIPMTRSGPGVAAGGQQYRQYHV